MATSSSSFAGTQFNRIDGGAAQLRIITRRNNSGASGAQEKNRKKVNKYENGGANGELIKVRRQERLGSAIKLAVERAKWNE